MSGTIFLALRILLATSLYAFLFFALVLLWRTLRQQSRSVSSRQVPPISLTIQQPDLPVQTEHFTQSVLTLGRDLTCECFLNDETVSARHARLSYHHGQWWLEDLRSRNGTYLNRENLLTPAVIVNGDEIGCGNIILTVRLCGDLELPPVES